MDDRTDIFRDLDTLFLELLHRGALRELVEELDGEEVAMPLASLDQLILARFEAYMEQRRASVYLIWLFGLIPLPVINYRSIWGRRRRFSFTRFVVSFLSSTVFTVLRVARSLMFLIGTLSYFHNVLRCFTMFGDVLAFSDNLFRDMMTFIFRNSTQLIQRNRTIAGHSGDCLYFARDDTSTWKLLTVAGYNLVAKSLRTTCPLPDDLNGCKPMSNTDVFARALYKQTPALIRECGVMTNSLPFRFAGVITRFFPHLKSPEYSSTLTMTVISLFLLYAVVGDILCLNVLAFFYFNLGKRILVYKDMYIGVGKLVWKTFGGMVG